MTQTYSDEEEEDYPGDKILQVGVASTSALISRQIFLQKQEDSDGELEQIKTELRKREPDVVKILYAEKSNPNKRSVERRKWRSTILEEGGEFLASSC